MHKTNVDPSREHAPFIHGPQFPEEATEIPGRYHPAGPGGKTTIIEHDEKAMLDSFVLKTAQSIVGEELPSSHNQYAQGIYRDHSYASTSGMED